MATDRVLRADEPLAVATVEAIRTGDVAALTRLVHDQPGLAAARIRAADHGAADREGADDVVAWLRARGAHTAAELTAVDGDGGR